jgi:hypothetical protein
MEQKHIFTSTHQAKAYLVSKIVEQAGWDKTPLSAAEIKMLHYSVDEPSVGDEVAAEFDRDCTEYEEGVAGLLSKRYASEKEKGELGEAERLASAIAMLAAEDHYLNVMIEQAGLKKSSAPTNSRVLIQALWILGPIMLAGLIIVFWDRL